MFLLLREKSQNWGETTRSQCFRQHNIKGAKRDRKFTHPLPKKAVRGFTELGCSGFSSTGAGGGQLHRNQGSPDAGLGRADSSRI